MKIKIPAVGLVMVLLILAVITTLNLEGNNVTGAFTLVDLAPEGFVYEEPLEVSLETVEAALNKAQGEIEQMERLNFSTTFVADILIEAEQAYQREDYDHVFELTQLITFMKKEKIEFSDKLKLTQEKELQLQEAGIEITRGEALIKQAETAFYADQLREAQILLQEANQEFNQAEIEQNRLTKISWLSKNFLLRHWWKILVIVVMLGIITTPLTKKVIKRRREHQLKRLRLELDKTKELIKHLQKECFIQKRITTKAYKEKVAKHEERIAELKHTIPVVEAQLTGKKVMEKKNKVKGIIEVKR